MFYKGSMYNFTEELLFLLESKWTVFRYFLFKLWIKNTFVFSFVQKYLVILGILHEYMHAFSTQTYVQRQNLVFCLFTKNDSSNEINKNILCNYHLSHTQKHAILQQPKMKRRIIRKLHETDTTCFKMTRTQTL